MSIDLANDTLEDATLNILEIRESDPEDEDSGKLISITEDPNTQKQEEEEDDDTENSSLTTSHLKSAILFGLKGFVAWHLSVVSILLGIAVVTKDKDGFNFAPLKTVYCDDPLILFEDLRDLKSNYFASAVFSVICFLGYYFCYKNNNEEET